MQLGKLGELDPVLPEIVLEAFPHVPGHGNEVAPCTFLCDVGSQSVPLTLLSMSHDLSVLWHQDPPRWHGRGLEGRLRGK